MEIHKQQFVYLQITQMFVNLIRGQYPRNLYNSEKKRTNNPIKIANRHMKKNG